MGLMEELVACCNLPHAGYPNNVDLMERARRCTALEAEILNNLPNHLDDTDAEHFIGLYGFEHVADRLERLGLTVVGAGDGYTLTEISKLRIFPMAQQSICLKLVFLEDALRALKKNCDARMRLETEGVIRNLGLLFRGIEPLQKVGKEVHSRLKDLEEEVNSRMVKKSEADQRGDSIWEDFWLLSRNERGEQFRADALRGLQARYPRADLDLCERIAHRMSACWKLLSFRLQDNRLGCHTVNPAILGPQQQQQRQQLLLPPPPQPPADATEHICPYCSDVLPVSVYQTPAMWQHHVLYDYSPYICLAKECWGNATFARLDDWVNHMRGHGGHWECSAPGCEQDTVSFGPHESDKVHRHAQLVHGWDKLPATALTKVPAARLEFTECPLCKEPFSGDGPEEAIKWHLAAHVETEMLSIRPLVSYAQTHSG
ncbi:hypothetical protein ASPACDRAFT_42009 [Aspergillus aculeatus ATCC 16872]|uniref:C2H2-type domain-containing protein n=1 Tax=Aspergillus aculeatus (strain ATCC 16872 / CBS 172.66 / WB 5094) TaxID=690307 RepID=A0A1L9WZP8_ASPA1|nr:uncharacterized protein ASPACDRAFT_42009 [Aspergillus aculeatus ATCC 16872]OJK01745.1 hypothetical protein ASPACDRAFT_42009 [Aspergillus aculeatus ATCC 16872]